ncbi:MAG: hypothetical protein HFG07_01295 [Oscillibacter sp.]|nr:hypothetical protein [Oscillibacter sp.]
MNIIIEIYLIVCVLLLLFDITFLFLKNHRNREFYPKNRDLEEELRKEIRLRRQAGAFSQEFEADLGAKLGKIRNLITLMDVLDKDRGAAGWFRPAVFAQIAEYQKKNDYEQAYYAYVVSGFDYESEPVPPEFAAKFLEFLDSKSLYTFANAMDALYQFGSTNLLLTALDKVDERQGFYHQKLLVDGLLSSRASVQELSPALVKAFDQYTPFLQGCLLDYFRMTGYDASALCLRLIQGGDSTDLEIRYGAMRYFAKYPSAQSQALFLDVLRREEGPWMDQMLAIQALENSEDPAVKDEVMKKVTSSNWYVRTKAVACLHRWGLSKSQIFDILYLRDKYADNALLYQYRNEKELSHYIIDTIQLLQRQDESADAEPLPV